MRGKKLHDNTPVLFKVSTHKAVIQLKELIDIHMQEVGAIKGKEENIDYTLPYIDKENLLKQKLIKINK
ncbi:hypothetical protein [Haploplasma axanthum]|uniref:Uncharacterized protein n=1 Tax=Haploplasma axanthum TaxID=29552 RepID=A0A449BBJ4_HAPAX|nr:hypothetical protein [Haploplasma axanthum]VEU79821.1 Uncharacterised protein [Haploplasma axanthum]